MCSEIMMIGCGPLGFSIGRNSHAELAAGSSNMRSEHVDCIHSMWRFHQMHTTIRLRTWHINIKWFLLYTGDWKIGVYFAMTSLCPVQFIRFIVSSSARAWTCICNDIVELLGRIRATEHSENEQENSRNAYQFFSFAFQSNRRFDREKIVETLME